jgi:hypothetical protein
VKIICYIGTDEDDDDDHHHIDSKVLDLVTCSGVINSHEFFEGSFLASFPTQLLFRN